jgi:riboflavin synthase
VAEGVESSDEEGDDKSIYRIHEEEEEEEVEVSARALRRAQAANVTALALRPSEKRDAAGVVGTRGAEGQKVSEI